MSKADIAKGCSPLCDLKLLQLWQYTQHTLVRLGNLRSLIFAGSQNYLTPAPPIGAPQQLVELIDIWCLLCIGGITIAVPF